MESEHFELHYAPYMDSICAYTCALYVSLLAAILHSYCKSSSQLQDKAFHHAMAGLNSTCCVLFVCATCVQTFYYHLIAEEDPPVATIDRAYDIFEVIMICYYMLTSFTHLLLGL